MIKRTCAAGFILLVLALDLSADWKQDVLGYLSPGRDYPAARAYLRENFAKIDPLEKSDALGLVAYLARMTGDSRDEQDRIVEYFETYGDTDPAFDLPDELLRRDFVTFWARWKSAYPLVTGLVFLERAGANDPSPPARLEIGLELLNGAYYKVSTSDRVLEGGLWQRGFHILKLPFSTGYDKPGSLEFNLDLKTGGMVVRKRITVEVDVRTGGPTASLPPIQAAAPGRLPPPRLVEGEVSLYVGDKLILKSKKLSSKPAPIIFRIPGPSPFGTKPYLAPKKDDPMLNTVSVLDALALAYQTVRDLIRKKKAGPASPPIYQKTQQLSFSFAREAPESGEVVYRGSLSMKPAAATVLRD
jgi:hypothetical protein